MRNWLINLLGGWTDDALDVYDREIAALDDRVASLKNQLVDESSQRVSNAKKLAALSDDLFGFVDGIGFAIDATETDAKEVCVFPEQGSGIVGSARAAYFTAVRVLGSLAAQRDAARERIEMLEAVLDAVGVDVSTIEQVEVTGDTPEEAAEKAGALMNALRAQGHHVAVRQVQSGELDS